MRDGLRYALLLLAGFVAVLLVVSLSAYSLTTYGSIRAIVGDVAAQPGQAASLQSQYKDMQKYFSEGRGDTFTYHFGAMPISIGRDQVSGLDEGRTLEMIVDIYASSLYLVKYNTGLMGSVGSIIGSSGNGMYAAITVALALALAVAGAAAVLPQWQGAFPARLKDAGKVLIIFCAVAFVFFLLAPGIVKSVVWDSIPNTGSGRDIVRVIESRITSSLLLNTLLMMALGLVLYAAGYVLGLGGAGKSAPIVSRTHARQQAGNAVRPRHRGL
jgi:hypothetical protein